MNDYKNPKPLKDWSEDDGSVLWWFFPIQEEPYVGTPLDEFFPEYVTHFTKIIEPVDIPDDCETKEDAINILKDFMENPDDYFSKKYPYIPMKFYDSVNMAIKLIDQPKLTPEQIIILDWLKNNFNSYGHDASIFETIADLTKIHKSFDDIGEAYIKLTTDEEAQVTELFAKWVTEQKK